MKASLIYTTLALVVGTTPVFSQSELEALRAENQALKAEILRLKGQTAPEKASAAPANASQPAPSTKTYTVARGDTLTKIARVSGCSLSTLLTANKLSKTAIIRPGQELKIPGRAAEAPTPATASTKTSSNRSIQKSDSNAPAEAPLPPIEGPVVAKRSVIIDQETTYGSFASRYRTTADQLNALNGFSLSPNTVLAKGSEIDVPAQP